MYLGDHCIHTEGVKSLKNVVLGIWENTRTCSAGLRLVGT